MPYDNRSYFISLFMYITFNYLLVTTSNQQSTPRLVLPSIRFKKLDDDRNLKIKTPEERRVLVALVFIDLDPTPNALCSQVSQEAAGPRASVSATPGREHNGRSVAVIGQSGRHAVAISRLLHHDWSSGGRVRHMPVHRWVVVLTR